MKTSRPSPLASLSLLLLLSLTLSAQASAQTRRKPTLNVRDFGAVGDGKTKDTTAIQRALDRCRAPAARGIVSRGELCYYLPESSRVVNEERRRVMCRPTFWSVVRAATLALLASLLPATTHGQQPTRSIEQLLRERQKTIYSRAMEDELRRPAERAEEKLRLALAQIAEDYEQIQLVNNDLAKATFDPNALDLKLAAESASEIRKRAERLLNNLALPELPADLERVKMPAEGEEQLRPSLGMLRRLVERFVRSPLFREVNVIDTQVSTRARRDLEGIIELSGRLKKDCEKYGSRTR